MMPLTLPDGVTKDRLWEVLGDGAGARRGRLFLLDTRERIEDEITDLMTEGSVDLDTTAEIDRSASITLEDPLYRVAFDATSPARAALYAHKLLRATYGVEVDGVWVDIPVCTGPISRYERNGKEVTLEFQGKEAWLIAPNVQWQTLHVAKGMFRNKAIRKIALNAGETHLSLEDISVKHAHKRISKDITVARKNERWKVMRHIARSMGDCQLFYDGAGTLRLREKPGENDAIPIPASFLIPGLTASYDLSSSRNAQYVEGQTTSGKKLSGTAVAERAHPLSAQSLGRYDDQGDLRPRWMADFDSRSHLRSNKSADDIAARMLRKKLIEQLEVTFECQPIPMLDPLDVLSVPIQRGLTADGERLTFSLNSFTIPLAAETMSIGYTKRIKVKR